MNIFLLVIIFAVCMYLLIKSSDVFVDAATVIANKLGVSHFIIGLTVVSIGTSLPELGASVFAALSNDSGMVIGNIVGSNIANTAFILGVGVLLVSLKIKKSYFMVDAPMLLLITGVFLILGLDYSYNYIDGLLMLLIFVFYVVFLTRREDVVTEAAIEETSHMPRKESNLYIQVSLLIAALIFLFVSAKYLVFSGKEIATIIGVSTEVVGLIGIAIGTSLPELAVTINSARKGHTELLIGNIIGSNISNILLIGGISSLITPLVVSSSILFFIYPILGFVTILLLVFMRLRSQFKQLEGVSFLLIYMFFLVVSVFIGLN